MSFHIFLFTLFITSLSTPPQAPITYQVQQSAMAAAPTAGGYPTQAPMSTAAGPYQAQQAQQQAPQQTVPAPSYFVPTTTTTAAPVAPAYTPQPPHPAGGAPPPPAHGAHPPHAQYPQQQAGGAPPGGPPQQAVAAPPASSRPAPPPGPPATISVATADVSAVRPELRPVVTSLTNLFNSCAPLANNPGAPFWLHV